MIMLFKYYLRSATQCKTMKETHNDDKLYTDKLKEYTENIAGFRMCTPKDFDILAQYIFNETGSLISSTTLKRLWGYLQEKEAQTPRLSTLNILSKYIGYFDYETFCKYQNSDGECESDFILNNCLQTRSLLKGDKIKLSWQPDRCVTILYMGLCMFKVLVSQNSKLSVNDIFICEHIVENQPLQLYNLIHENGEPVNYICGKKGGVKYHIMNNKQTNK